MERSLMPGDARVAAGSFGDIMKQKPTGPSLQCVADLRKRLKRRTSELAAANRLVQRHILRRRREQAGHRKSGADNAALLKESLKLQEGLRHTTHQNISAQEEERHTISRQLQDDIAQTLLGVHARLMNLRAAVRGDQSNLAKDIASTQRLVRESVKSINRFARRLKLHQRAPGDPFTHTSGTMPAGT